MRLRSVKLIKPYVAWGAHLAGTITADMGYNLDYKQGMLTIRHDRFERAAEQAVPEGTADVSDACAKIPVSNIEGMTPWTDRDKERENAKLAALKAAEEAEE